MKRFFRTKNIRVTITILFLIVHLLLLLPLYIIGLYDVPAVDDYGAASVLRVAMQASNNPLEWIRALWNNMVHIYNSWQGTFSSVFFNVCPLAVSDTNYYLCPFLLLTLFQVSLLTLLYQVLHKRLILSVHHTIILYTILSTLFVQLMPSAVEGFYWWSGAFLYIGFLSVAMLTVSLYLHVASKTFSVKRFAGYLVLGCLLFIIAGSNYPTAIATFILFGYIFLHSLLYKRKNLPLAGLSLLFSAVGLLLNVIAPGNSLRMTVEGVNYVPTLQKTLMISFRLGFQFFRTWMTTPVFLGVLVAIPVIYDALRKATIRFRYPLVYSIASLCMYCAMFSPTAQSYGWIGPARYMNVVYFGFLFFLLSNLFYYIGWFCTKVNAALADRLPERETAEHAVLLQLKPYLWAAAVFVLAFTFVISRPNFYMDATTPARRTPYTTESAFRDLASGNAQNYHTEYMNRLTVLWNPDVKDAMLYPFSTKPALLFFDDVTADTSDWRNALVASFYGKDSVVLIE